MLCQEGSSQNLKDFIIYNFIEGKVNKCLKGISLVNIFRNFYGKIFSYKK